MTGLEKMKSQILDEANAVSEEKIAEAKKQAEEILNAAKDHAEKEAASILQKSETDVASYKERVASTSDLQRRTKILAAKQEVIGEVLDKAYTSVVNMDAEEYFAMLLKILDKYAQPQDGVMYLSAKDKERLPADFEAKAKECAAQKGGSLTVSDESKNLENGFVLAYGGVEENCTLRAMFDAKADELSDKVHGILFS